MAAMAGRWFGFRPDVGRRQLAKHASRPPAAISGRVAHRGHGMAGGAHEPCVLVVRDGKAADEEIAR